jgi:NAD(P)-dependent dehydrogenase (short-subunit alcohol dehydrogenase family)
VGAASLGSGHLTVFKRHENSLRSIGSGFYTKRVRVRAIYTTQRSMSTRHCDSYVVVFTFGNAFEFNRPRFNGYGETAATATAAWGNAVTLHPGVLVTGASTGIGYATVKLLAHEGYLVFAGVRTQDDIERLRSEHEHIRPVFIDVCDSSRIAAAVQDISQSSTPLFALVNNAGIAVAGPLEYLPLEDFRRAFEVNVFGTLAVTQACLPLLRRTNGRIIFMSSVSGQIAPPMIGPYAASKFALEAMADSMRMELSPFGVSVSVLQPGSVRTPIWEKGRREKEHLAPRISPLAAQYYEKELNNLEQVARREERCGIEPEVVAQTVLRALRAERPRARYVVGSPPGWQRRVATLLPERIRDRFMTEDLLRH